MIDNPVKQPPRRHMILGSQSPRRKEILQFFTLPFSQIPSHFDEDQIPFTGDPAEYALQLAQKKGELLLEQFPSELIITADTVVYLNGKIYNKPKHQEEAANFLRELSGQWHEVVTGVCITTNKKRVSQTESTKILFNQLSEQHITQYLSHLAFSDKAGGYAIQQGGGIIVSKIEGCYYNVMGLPLNTLSQLLLAFEIDLWQHVKIF